jgi:hypothetical protein
MRSLFKSVFVAVALSAAAPVLAADGSSGCGPGWYVFKDNSLVSSSLRSTTNGFLFPSVTIGMTLGTSNCAKHKIVMKEKESLHMATMAYHDLMIQVASGRGEHLAAFAHTLGCDWRAQDEFNRVMQANYQTLFPGTSDDPSLVVGGAVEQIRANPVLASQCTAGIG